MNKYQSVELGQVSPFRDLKRLPMQLKGVNTGEAFIKVESLNGLGGENVRTTQEVQTSFRPSIRDSAEYKNMGDSIVNLSIEKDGGVACLLSMDQVGTVDKAGQEDVIGEGIDISQMTMHFLAVENHAHSPMQQLNNLNEMLHGSNMQRQVKSNPATVRESPPARQASSQNQMLHQIYIQVNTGECGGPENNIDEHTFSGDSIPGLSYPMRPRHHSKDTPSSPPQASVLAGRSASTGGVAPGKKQKKMIAVKGRKISTEMLGSQGVQSTISIGKANHSLFDQPIVLGVRAVKRQKTKSNETLSQLVSVMNQTAAFGKQDTVSPQQNPFQAMKVVGLGANTRLAKKPQPKTINNQAVNTKKKTNSGKEKLHLLIGPQVIQWLSPEQAADAQADGLQIIHQMNEPQNQNYFQGQPIVIDSNTKLGRHLIQETKKRNQMKEFEKNHSLRQIKDKQIRKDMLNYYRQGRLTDNKLPSPALAKFHDRKISKKNKKASELQKMEVYRERAWKQYHMETKLAKNQTASQIKESKVQDVMMPRAETDPIGGQLKPWSQANFLHIEDGIGRPQSTDSFNQWNNECDRPSSGPDILQAVSAQPSVENKGGEEVTDEAMAFEIMLSDSYSRQLGTNNPNSPASTQQQQQQTVYKTLNTTDILMSPQLQNTTLSSDQHTQNLNPNAIFLRTNSLVQIAPILQSSRQLSKRCASSRPASIDSVSPPPPASAQSDGGTDGDQKDAATSAEIGGVEAPEQFGQRIKNMYLPCTLRKLYYKELKLRKPIFVGASKKGVGFDHVTPLQGINERTSVALLNQQLIAKQSRVASKECKPASPGLQNNENFLKVCSAKLCRKQGAQKVAKTQVSLIMTPSQRRLCCKLKTDVTPTQITPIKEIEVMDPCTDFELLNEAEDRVFSDGSKQTKLIATNRDQKDFSDSKKSKVIFSVKKHPSNNIIDEIGSKAAQKPDAPVPQMELISPYEPIERSCLNQQTPAQQPQLETDRSPELKVNSTDGDLRAQEFNVTQIKITVSTDGPPLLLQKGEGAKESLGQQNIESSNFVHSYTCADLGNVQLQPGIKNRRVRSAKYSVPVPTKKDANQTAFVPLVEKKSSAPNGRDTETPADKASVNIVINSANNSSFGRINIGSVQQQQQQLQINSQLQDRTTSRTETENNQNLARQQSNHQARWLDGAAEIDNPSQIGNKGIKNQLKKAKVSQKQALTPKIVNLSLGKTANACNSAENKSKNLQVTTQPNQTKIINLLQSISTERKIYVLDKVEEVKKDKNLLPIIPRTDNETKVSQRSFYISEDDSQHTHTLSPVAHQQNRNKGFSFCAQQRANKFLRAKLSLGNHAIHMQTRQVTEAAPPCTCNLVTEKQDSRTSVQVDSMRSAAGHLLQSRVVFVMKSKEEGNNDKKQLQMRAISQDSQTNNNDLAHLPIYKAGEGDDLIEEDAGATPQSFGNPTPPQHKLNSFQSKNNDILMKSEASNHLHTSSGQKINERLVIQSNKRSQEGQKVRRSHTEMNRQHAEGSPLNDNYLSAESSHRWVNQHHVLPAVNSDSKLTMGNHVQGSYGDIVNLNLQSNSNHEKDQDNDLTIAKQRTHNHSSTRFSTLQVKMRLGKNPNQCPPRLSALGGQKRPRRQSSKPSVKEILQNCSSKGFKTRKPSDLDNLEPMTASNKVITVTVHTDSNQILINEDDGDNDREVIHQIIEGQMQQLYPGFNTLSPVQLVSAEDLSQLELNITEPPPNSFESRVGSDHVMVTDYANSGPTMDKLPSQPALNYQQRGQLSKNQLIGGGKNLLVKSQCSIGNHRMNRLQRLYQTQRGRNIMSLVGTKVNKREPQQTQFSPSIQMIGKMATLASTNDRTYNSYSQQNNSRNLMKLKAVSGGADIDQTILGKVDVGQSIQRFSIHLSPRNQTVSFRSGLNGEQNSECQYHKQLHLQSQDKEFASERTAQAQATIDQPKTQFTTTFQQRNLSEIPSSLTRNQAQLSARRVTAFEPPQMASPGGQQNLMDFVTKSAVSSVGRRRKQHSQIRRGSIVRNLSRPMTTAGVTAREDNLDLRKDASGAMQILQKRIVKGLASRHYTATLQAQGINIAEHPPSMLLEKRKTSMTPGSTVAQTITPTNQSASRRASVKRNFDRKRSAPKRQAAVKKQTETKLNIEDHKYGNTIKAKTGSLINLTAETTGQNTTSAVLRKHIFNR